MDNLITCTANLSSINLNLAVSIGLVLLGALIASLLWWYWVRKYGGKLEDKVKDVADQVSDKLQTKIEDLIKDKLKT